jgi:hypothetical protein
MADRITNKMVETQFAWLCDVLGKRIAQHHKDVGAWRLDYQRCYGGFCIVELMEHGESLPYGHGRYKASEMFNMLQFALRSIAIDRFDGETFTGSFWPTDKITNARN